MNIIDEHGFRNDGRRPPQIRNINCRLGVYPKAEGSAYIEQGNTKVCIVKVFSTFFLFRFSVLFTVLMKAAGLGNWKIVA